MEMIEHLKSMQKENALHVLLGLMSCVQKVRWIPNCFEDTRALYFSQVLVPLLGDTMKWNVSGSGVLRTGYCFWECSCHVPSPKNNGLCIYYPICLSVCVCPVIDWCPMQGAFPLMMIASEQILFTPWNLFCCLCQMTWHALAQHQFLHIAVIPHLGTRYEHNWWFIAVHLLIYRFFMLFCQDDLDNAWTTSDKIECGSCICRIPWVKQQAFSW